VPSTYGQYPVEGAFMLELRAEPGVTGTYAVASQALSGLWNASDDALPAGDYVLSFKQRTITHEDNHWTDLAACEAHANPWFVARLDSASGNTILHESDPSSWCSTMLRLDGVHYAEPDWVDVEVPVSLAADTPGATLTFHVGTSYPHRHIVLVDSVVFRPAG
jgi:hypothetical protein